MLISKQRYTFNQHRVAHYFCPECGSSLFAQSCDPGFKPMDIKAVNVSFATSMEGDGVGSGVRRGLQKCGLLIVKGVGQTVSGFGFDDVEAAGGGWAECVRSRKKGVGSKGWPVGCNDLRTKKRCTRGRESDRKCRMYLGD
jgi:hypothetical protein